MLRGLPLGSACVIVSGERHQCLVPIGGRESRVPSVERTHTTFPAHGHVAEAVPVPE
jgi:hypothetical protein